MLIILIDRWQVLSYLIRMSLLNQANHAIWQKSWSTSIVLTVFPWILEVNASKEEKRACPFSSSTPRRKKTTKSFCKEWASKLAESDKGYYYNQEKWLNIWQSSWKTIETTAESSLTSFLASGASFFGREAVRRATKSREVPRHIKIGRRTVLKVYCSGREASRKTPGSGLLSIFPGKCRTFRKCIEYSGLSSTWLARCENEMCSSQISNDAF